MAYTVLARRYRSGTFDEVIGQNHIAQTLKKAISSGRVAHAFLFCGTRGTGKTSTARILAKALNCSSGKNEGPVTEPCSKCDSCLGIARGDDIDVIEIDAASNTGVDNIRELIENSQYRPVRSRYKIYIIDEVHMLSKSAFNALLKTLEEPPGHVKFILATTEAEKVLPTILSRCQRYDFRNIPTREIAAHLADICKREKIDADEDALLLVAKAGAGSMRDSLSLLDRLLSIGEKNLNIDMIEQLLGLPKVQLLFEMADAVGRGDVKDTLNRLDTILKTGMSADAFLSAFIDHLRNLLVLSACGMESRLVEVPGLSPAELTRQAAAFDTISLSQNIAILEELRRHIRQSNASRAILDAAMVRLALAKQFASVAEVLSHLRDGDDDSTQKKKSELIVSGSGVSVSPVSPSAGRISPTSSIPTVAAPMELDLGDDDPADSIDDQHSQAVGAKSEVFMPAMDVQAPHPVESLEVPILEEVIATDDTDDALPAVGKVWNDDAPRKSLATIMAEKKRQQEANAATNRTAPALSNPETVTVNVGDLTGVYQSLLNIISAKSPSLHGLLMNARLAFADEGRAVIQYPQSNKMTMQLVDKAGKRESIVEALSEVFRKPMQVKFELDPNGPAETSIGPDRSEPTRPVRNHSNGNANSGQQNIAPPAPNPEIPAANAIRLTAELREKLEADPLIRAIIELGGNIVKVE